MNTKKIIYFLLGVIFTLLLFFGFQSFFKIDNKETKNDYFILKNQISHMNKMVVMEQDFYSIQKNSVSYKILGKEISNNQIITHTKTNAQVSYDLNKMKIKIDSTNKKLIIKQLPKAEIKITPSVEIQSMNDSFFNRINEKQIKEVTQTAKQNAIQKVNKKQLLEKGQKQLFQNFNQIFVLAKALGYQITDQTKKLTPNRF